MSDQTQPKKAFPEERRYQYLISGISDYAIYMLDPAGHVCPRQNGYRR